MGSQISLRATALSKCYKIVTDDLPAATNMGEAITRKLRNPLKKRSVEDFWALRGVDLQVQRGEVLGVVGRNGAGKSTFFKLLSRITEPTEGRIELYGRVGALLEVGTGFHHELTGRENVYLNGSILGMKRREIREKFDEIVAFAGVEKFIDTPVKRYSSGMYVRLAFAVAANLNPEILIVDEVLAVGDAEFQKKCLGKIRDVASSGRTVLFVSHNMAAVRELCTRAALLSGGRLACVGEVDEVLQEYMSGAGVESVLEREFPLDPVQAVAITKIAVRPDSAVGVFRTDAAFEVVVRYEVPEDVKGTAIVLQVHHNGGAVFEAFDSDAVDGVHECRRAGVYEAVMAVPSNYFTAGTISVSVAVDFTRNMRCFDCKHAVSFDLPEYQDVQHTARAPMRHNTVQDPSKWSVERLAEARRGEFVE